MGDISTRLHSEQEENAANQATLTRMANFINGEFHSIRRKNEEGDTKTVLLENKWVL